MTQTYSEFKAYLAEFIWRPNDTVLSNNLDSLIKMADAELNRKLDLQRRSVSTSIAPEAEDYSLPSDFYQMASLVNNQRTRQATNDKFMRNSTKADIDALRVRTNSAYIYPYYHVRRAKDTNTLYLVGPFSASNPGDFELNYRTAIPDFQTDDSSWVETDYLDLYTYAVLKHVALFVREEQRVQFYQSLLMEALDSAIREDKHKVQYGGSPLHMKPNRAVPRKHRR